MCSMCIGRSSLKDAQISDSEVVTARDHAPSLQRAVTPFHETTVATFRHGVVTCMWFGK